MSHVPEIQDIDRRLRPSLFEGEDKLILYADFGEESPLPDGTTEPMVDHLYLDLPRGMKLEEQFDRAASRPRTHAPYESPDSQLYIPSRAFLRSVLSLAVATCFFIADEHEVVAPDIPRRLVERYTRARAAGEAGKEEEASILKRSRELGHYGWHLGREVTLPRPLIVDHGHAGGVPPRGEGWELRFFHIRSGHMRWQVCGPREQPQRRLVFIAPTVVRPDLPAPPTPHRYAIRDSELPAVKDDGPPPRPAPPSP